MKIANKILKRDINASLPLKATRYVTRFLFVSNHCYKRFHRARIFFLGGENILSPWVDETVSNLGKAKDNHWRLISLF